ncbi:hypothetical protein BLA24064_03032 [Burkholderia latens]|uniref:Uncharacterized protein n=1 Tax=Burkholderia latens TaxID=488446 RepID=A0A6P2L652_9BURK|nr:hypothetical protein BLA24064_03032 [Burkholderia latens]
MAGAARAVNPPTEPHAARPRSRGHDASSHPNPACGTPCAAQLPRYSDFISSALAGRTPIAREPDADAPCACAP